jgi:hypothetical protein
MSEQETKALIRYLRDSCRLAEYVLTQLDINKADMGGEVMVVLREAQTRAKAVIV